MLSNNFKKYFLPALFIVAVVISLLKPSTNNLVQVAAKIQSTLNNDEEIFKWAAKDSILPPALLADNDENALQVKDITESGILFYYYKKDSLVYWTSNSVMPLSLPSVLHQSTSFIKLKNGWYQAMKAYDTLTQEALVGLVPVKYEYPFENKFLKNDFAFNFDIANNIEISEQKSKGSVPVKSIDEKTLFNLYISADEKDDAVNWILLLAHVTFLLIIFYYIQIFSARLVKNKSFAAGLFVLVVLVLAIRCFMLWFDSYSELSKLELFSPKYYASSTIITNSLGDLIINTFLFVWIILFCIYYKSKWNNAIKNSAWACWVLLAGVSVYTGVLIWLFKTLVVDSVISFEVYNILNLNLYSVLGLVCIALLFITHFLIARSAILVFIEKKIKLIYSSLFVLIIVVCYLLFSLGPNFSGVIVFSAMWNVVYVMALYAVLKKNSSISVGNLILYVALYGLLSTFLIEHLYEGKERNQRKFFASRLVTERDFVAEYMFDDVASRISEDPFINNYFKNFSVSKKEITSRLSSLYLSGYFNKYDVKVYTYDKHGSPQKNRDTLSLNYFYAQVDTDSVNGQQLYYINDTSGNYSYLSFFKFDEDSLYAGELVLHLIPKIYYGQNVYPELLLGENISTMLDDNRYNYAIYRHNKLINQHGDFPYSYYWNKDFKFDDKQYVFIDIGEWEHIIYRFANDMKVIVSIGHESLFEPVATFSYLFTFYFILVITGLILFRSFTDWPAYSNILIDRALSFRTRINYSMLMMIVASFIIIGFITINFFTKQYNNFYTDRLVRKEKVLQASLEYFIQQNLQSNDTIFNERLSNVLSFEIARLAEINDIDINLYDPEGNLTVESQPAIYDKGLVSKKMNPNAYFELATSKSAQITEQENIGGLKYLATYSPIRNATGTAIAYLGIPYFERSKNVADEVSSFLVALINVYVFIFICAALLAYFISNSITRPLTIISEKLRILNLNKKNEPIEWKSNDEIGILVGEYNKMIKELEQSAYKLARSERESAWREMAKQIAHEIKNPLTPMKLSIQHLQRAINNHDSNINELAQKVTRTLEEQIENLASIATAFSSFAKMPKAQNEVINLNDLLKSIVHLFNREETIDISFKTEIESPLVFADKNQLVSVFNNLVKNAIQSIPENRAGLIDIQLIEENGWLTVSISDNGVGIPQGNYEKVFVPNFTTKSSGTGLGLAISRQIIEGAGGEIWFKSVENTGSCFYVQLRKSEVV